MREKRLKYRDTIEFDISDDTVEVLPDDEEVWAELDPSELDANKPRDTVQMFDPEVTIRTPPPVMVEDEVISGEIECRPAPLQRHHVDVTDTGIFGATEAERWPGGLERRSNSRLLLPRPLKFRLAAHPIPSAARLFDLSRGGLFVETARHILPGNYVCGSFDVDGEVITFKGEVVWKTNPDRYPHTGRDGFGVRFVMNDEEMTRIDRLLRL